MIIRFQAEVGKAKTTNGRYQQWSWCRRTEGKFPEEKLRILFCSKKPTRQPLQRRPLRMSRAHLVPTSGCWE